ncbi:hypothetical protein [Mesorhizobium sp.]|uniref:hypothetical protein n=1 Tax=Mesorhizobium sp. TaxID=1871066 RepID=UPI000FE6DF91|nr:hypothetical protein [Mesorhizobium sp.]RWP07139.1 MAG: hypothetical protein EOR00_33480 [Mesorhizobium sp.]RWQ21387.1 MAG: hypothetical protein EOS19_31540 [Mesorhizobium sp.]TIL33258.1 MAG: hypothetical protein E5Y82_26945 [Mesorhizobium sp.]
MSAPATRQLLLVPGLLRCRQPTCIFNGFFMLVGFFYGKTQSPSQGWGRFSDKSNGGLSYNTDLWFWI